MAKPTPVNKPIFFGLRFFQFVTAVIALGIVAYFQYVLWRDGYSIPWEFAILNAAVNIPPLPTLPPSAARASQVLAWILKNES